VTIRVFTAVLHAQRAFPALVLTWMVLCLGITAPSKAPEQPEGVVLPADSPRWDLQGKARVVDHQGRKALRLEGGAAVVKDLLLRDGIVDVDVSTPAPRGFFGIQFRLADDGANGEFVYLRQHRSGAPDAMQYTPILRTGLNWQLYNGPGFTGATAIPPDGWFHLRLEVAGARARLYVADMEHPALVMDDLKSGVQEGELALYVLTGETYFSNFKVRQTPAVAWERHLPPMPKGTLVRWSLSPSYEASERHLERPLSANELKAIAWQEVAAEPPGLVVINRYRDAPHPRVSFQGDFSKRLEAQPGMRVVYARSTLNADQDQVKRLALGYSDDVHVFLNGKILYRGRSAQGFRDPGFLGIVNPENDTLYLPLKQGANELVLAVSELGGGWGFIARLEDLGE
jgi:hypothetical protein